MTTSPTMEVLNWVAEHWVLAIVLTLIVSGALQNIIRELFRK